MLCTVYYTTLYYTMCCRLEGRGYYCTVTIYIYIYELILVLIIVPVLLY